MKKILLFLGKNILILLLLGIIVGRLFFPKTLEETVITPARRMPVFGQVLGVTWDKMGKVGPTIQDKTVSLADTIETTDLPIDETVMSVVSSENPSEAATQVVEKQVQSTVDKIENLPSDVLEEVKKQVRREMYQQICTEWLDEEETE